jgi:hypothetical protein
VFFAESFLGVSIVGYQTIFWAKFDGPIATAPFFHSGLSMMNKDISALFRLAPIQLPSKNTLNNTSHCFVFLKQDSDQFGI